MVNYGYRYKAMMVKLADTKICVFTRMTTKFKKFYIIANFVVTQKELWKNHS